MGVSDLVSVVITTYNRSDALLAVLHGLAQQTDTGFEVIVADDGSREEQQRLILESSMAARLRLTHVWHPDVGFTASRIRNRGVAAARGSYLIFLDGDCVPERDFVARHRLLAESGVFVNGSRVLLSEALTREVVAGRVHVTGRSAAFWLAHRLRGDASKLTGLLRLPDGAYRVRKGFSWKGIRSCNFGLWRKDFERVDGFDESFVGWGHEDADLVLRLHHAGLARKNGFCATEVYHLWHREADRGHESANWRTVQQRAQTDIVRAASGYGQKRPNDDAVITRLG